MTTSTQPDSKFDVTAEFADLPQAQVKQLLRAVKLREAAKKKADDALKAAQQNIIDLMRGAEVLRIEETQQEVVTHRVVEAMIIDTAKLKKEQPELVAKYQKPRTSRPLKVLV